MSAGAGAEPSPGSGACPRCALAAGRDGTGGMGIPALRDPEGCGVPGGSCRCAGASLAHRNPAVPGAAAAASSPMSCSGRGAGSEVGRVWAFLGSFPAPLPRIPALGFALRSRKLGDAGEDAPGSGPARRPVPVPAAPPGSLSFRPCTAMGCLGPEGES